MRNYSISSEAAAKGQEEADREARILIETYKSKCDEKKLNVMTNDIIGKIKLLLLILLFIKKQKR